MIEELDRHNLTVENGRIKEKPNSGFRVWKKNGDIDILSMPVDVLETVLEWFEFDYKKNGVPS